MQKPPWAIECTFVSHSEFYRLFILDTVHIESISHTIDLIHIARYTHDHITTISQNLIYTAQTLTHTPYPTSTSPAKLSE